MTARTTFDHELELLGTDMIKMSSLVENAIESSIHAFKNQDSHEAQTIIEADHKIDDIEKQIESRCLTLILRQQPVASDLRTISTALKMVTDLERIGDNASDIAEISMRITGEHIYTMVKHIPEMSTIAVQMVHDAITSFVETDLEAAREIMKRDDQVDDLFNCVKQELVNTLRNEAGDADNAIDFLMIAKYLERIADHAVNICEWVEFLCTGKHKNTRIV